MSIPQSEITNSVITKPVIVLIEDNEKAVEGYTQSLKMVIENCPEIILFKNHENINDNLKAIEKSGAKIVYILSDKDTTPERGDGFKWLRKCLEENISLPAPVILHTSGEVGEIQIFYNKMKEKKYGKDYKPENPVLFIGKDNFFEITVLKIKEHIEGNKAKDIIL